MKFPILAVKVQRIIIRFIVSVFIVFTCIWKIIAPIKSLLPNLKIDGIAMFVLVILISVVIGFIIAKPRKQVKLKINNMNIDIFYGDIFQTKGYKVISVNEFFDSEIGLPVSPNSLHGKFISEVLGGQASSFNTLVDEALKGVEYKKVKRQKGNEKQYPIGTTATVECSSQKYFLVALTKTDISSLKASASKKDYIQALDALWDEVRIHSNGYVVNVPLIGNGLSGVKLCPQQLLNYMLVSLSMKDELIASNITIVLHNNQKDDIDLDLIKQMWL